MSPTSTGPRASTRASAGGWTPTLPSATTSGSCSSRRPESRVAGPDPDTASSYSNYASFSDPDGNVWLLQQITKRLPGRTWEADPADVAARAALLKDTAIHHGSFEAGAPPPHLWGRDPADMLAPPGRDDE